MAFQVSPGVEVKEIDLTNIVPAVSTTNAGFAGFFEWGPIDQKVTVTSIDDLKRSIWRSNLSQRKLLVHCCKLPLVRLKSLKLFECILTVHKTLVILVVFSSRMLQTTTQNLQHRMLTLQQTALLLSLPVVMLSSDTGDGIIYW